MVLGTSCKLLKKNYFSDKYSNNKWLECFRPFRVESGVKVGTPVRALCHFLSLDVMALTKRNK